MVYNNSPAEGVQVATLLFDAGTRPDAPALQALAAIDGAFTVSHRADDSSGWAEVLREGLTFDLGGLRPAAAATLHLGRHVVGLPRGFDFATVEAVSLMPGPHLAGAEHLLPVVRVTAGLIAGLASLPGLRAIVWHPAGVVMSPAWFVEAVGAWIAGGPFPALALTALRREEVGLESEGLAFLIEQEFLLVAGEDGPIERDARIAVRLTDWLVAHGRVDSAREVVLAGIGPIWLEPDGKGLLVARWLETAPLKPGL